MRLLAALNKKLSNIFATLCYPEKKLLRALADNYHYSGRWWAFCLSIFYALLLLAIIYFITVHFCYLVRILPSATYQKTTFMGIVVHIGIYIGLINASLTPRLRLATTILAIGLLNDIIWHWEFNSLIFWGFFSLIGFSIELWIYRLIKARHSANSYAALYLRGIATIALVLLLVFYLCLLLPLLLLVICPIGIGKTVEKMLWHWWPKWRIKAFAVATQEIVQKREMR